MSAYKGPAIVDLVGFVEEVSQFGVAMMRIDVPSDPPATHFCGGASIYCLTPTTEEAVAEANKPWVEPARYQLPMRTDDDSAGPDINMDDIPY